MRQGLGSGDQLILAIALGLAFQVQRQIGEVGRQWRIPATAQQGEAPLDVGQFSGQVWHAGLRAHSQAPLL